MVDDRRLKDSALFGICKDLFGDVADLVQKEIKLARAEITRNVSAKLASAVWVAIAGACGFLAILFALAAAVLGIGSMGIPLHWAALIVAAALAAIAAGAFLYGRTLGRGSLAPTRTLQHVTADLRAAREQLS